MKTTPVFITIFSLMCANLSVASDTHEADRGLEGTLRATLNERHVHVDVHHGTVTLDGEVPTTTDRDRIVAWVRNTRGVVAVKDKLRVKFPAPGVYGASPTSVPVYATPPPVVAVPENTVTPAAPVIVPDYSKVKVQPATRDDEALAHRIAERLAENGASRIGQENLTITVSNGNVSLQGFVESPQQREALIATVQQAGGAKAIYDQLQIR
jgi:osmotically-inducible protein OsmY